MSPSDEKVDKKRKRCRNDEQKKEDKKPRIKQDSEAEGSNAQPTLGWCTDEAVLKRRAKQIEMAKSKEVYLKYSSEVPHSQRVKGCHPRTPNRLINYSRRSWDALVKNWKKSLHEYQGKSTSV